MIYQPGDYVYPADLPRRMLCRVAKAESLDVRHGTGQVLKLEPLEGPWSPGTSLIRLDEYVIPARPRQLWHRPATNHRHPPRRDHHNAAA